jgi:hypothetical protein
MVSEHCPLLSARYGINDYDGDDDGCDDNDDDDSNGFANR